MRLLLATELYTKHKRDSGVEFRDAESRFAALLKQVGNLDLDQITARQVSAYLAQGDVATSTWRIKYFFLRRFFEYWALRGEMQMIQLPLPKRPVQQTFLPHTYTRAELRSLSRSATVCQQGLTIGPESMRGLVLFLYGTGAKVGEVLNLRVSDFDANDRTILFRSTGFRRERHLPLNSELCGLLRRNLRLESKFACGDQPLFSRRCGGRITAGTLMQSFRRLCRVAGVSRHDGTGRSPRLQDLRSTFAVHRITSWIRAGEDLDCMLPALAAYLGQKSFESSERYLVLTPERFHRQLRALSPASRPFHWRDNKRLMQFLGNLNCASRFS